MDELFLTYVEIAELREAEQQQAERRAPGRRRGRAGRQPSDERLTPNRQRAERLAAKLRELGIEPD